MFNQPLTYSSLKSAIKASSNKPKKDKKKIKKDYVSTEPSDNEATSKQATVVTADDFVDDEWGPLKDKGKKSKKGKNNQHKAVKENIEDVETKPGGSYQD